MLSSLVSSVLYAFLPVLRPHPRECSQRVFGVRINISVLWTRILRLSKVQLDGLGEVGSHCSVSSQGLSWYYSGRSVPHFEFTQLKYTSPTSE